MEKVVMDRVKPKFYVAVDGVVFTIKDNDLKILLIKRLREPFKHMFALPGGFVEENESLEQAIKRELREETGVDNIFLKRLHAFGDVDRDPRGRVITCAYIALIDHNKVRLKADYDAETVAWFSVHHLPNLAFDHKKIIDHASHHLKYMIETTDIAFELLPDKFTLTELQRVYETIMAEKLDKRNFRKMIKSMNILKDKHETKMEGAHRPARLYSFKKTDF